MKKTALFFVTFLSLYSHGQELVRYKFDHFTPESGLSSIYARKIIQDPYGFVWVGTMDGLNRYNGKTFSVYNNNVPGTHALTGSDIRDLLIDTASHSIWCVNSYGGIDQINYVTGDVVFHYYQNRDPQMKDILLCSLTLYQNQLYIGSSRGVFTLNLQSKQFRKIAFKNPWVVNNADPVVDKLLLDRKKRLWIFCAGNGICIIDPPTRAVIGICPANYKAPGIRYYDVCALADESILTATNVGLLQYTPDSDGQAIRIQPKSFSGVSGNAYACAQDRSGTIWFAQPNQLVRIDGNTGKKTLVKENVSRADPDWISSVYSIYFDNTNRIWLGCQQGLASADTKPAPFLRFTTSATSQAKIGHAYYLEPVSDSLLYCCAQDGLYEVHTNSGAIVAIREKKPFYHFFQDPWGEKITANIDGSFVLQNGKLIPLEQVYPVFKSLGKIVVNSHFQIGDSLLIMGTENNRGVVVWNYKKNKAVNISSDTQGEQLRENTVNGLFKDRADRIWILGDHSISLLDLKTFRLSWFIPHDTIAQNYFSIFFDVCQVRDKYYLASYGSGIVVLDSLLRFEQQITTANGLSANSVYKILSWRDSLLFVTSNNGISTITFLPHFRIHTYYESDGLHGNVFEENSGSMYQQIIFAGGADGVTRIDPTLLPIYPPIGKTYIDLVSIQTAAGYTDKMDLQTRKIEIPDNALQTTIYFSHTDFSNSERIFFAYRIRELGDGWVQLGTRNFVSPIGLAPGTYHVEVKAGRADNLQMETGTSFILKMLPKWYQTWWFRLSIAISIASLFYAFYRYRLLQVKKQQQIRKEIASDLHDDIGSTLNSIKIFTHLALKDPDNVQYLRHIEESLMQTSIGLRDMIWVLDDSRDTVFGILERIKNYAQPVCQVKNIRFESQIQANDSHLSLNKTEKRNLLLIAKEAVNNSIKYSGCDRIDLTIRQSKSKLYMMIADNGRGFCHEASPVGNGLKNIKHRAKQINAVVEITFSKAGTKILIIKN